VKEPTKPPKKPEEGPKITTDGAGAKLGVRYDDYTARYATQVGIRTTPEEVFLEFSSGVIPDPATGQPVMPVHTRIAMTHAGARRLSEVLAQTFARSSAPESSGKK
jgi:hypothetical protein